MLLKQDCPISQIITQLEETIPTLKGFAEGGSVRIAVNQAFINNDEIIHPGDEVAFLPPFSGG